MLSLSAISAIPLFDGGFRVYIDGFGKTQIRVDAYFALKKIEADWAPEWARPAGLGPFWPLPVPSFAYGLFSLFLILAQL